MSARAHSRSSAVPAAALTLALASALCGQQQETGPDWQKDVEKACTSPRYGLRLAASKRVAAGGDAAVPAVRAFAQAHGDNAIPVALVEAIGDGGGKGEAVVTLLHDWASNREFYWRGQAMKGLALRSRDTAIGARCRELFARVSSDPAWLVRTFARVGAYTVGHFEFANIHDGKILRVDADPRAATKFAAHVVATNDFINVDARLVESLTDERTFLGDPWGKRRATEACAALKRIHGKDWGYRPDAGYAANKTAVEASSKDLGARVPVHLVDPEIAFTGGIEILSCKNGDLFVRWTKDGGLSIGTTPVHESLLTLDPTRWQPLSAAATALQLPAQSGVVICDRMRIALAPDRPQAAIAPAALPAAAADWLKQLAAAIEEAGQPILATALRDRLAQFAAP